MRSYLNGSEVNQFLALSFNPTVDLPVLPPPSVVVRKVKTGFAALPASFWQNGVGKAMQRGILSLAALLLLALPISLGFIFAHNGSQVNQPLSISGAFASGIVAGKTLPAKQTTPTVNGGGKLPAQTSTASSHTPPQITWNASEGDEQGHGHGHGHGLGHKHHGD